MSDTEMPELTEAINKLLDEKKQLQDEITSLTRDLKKCEREIRVSKSFLDKVTIAAEAKDTLNMALSDANALQRAYMDMLLQTCRNIIILLDDEGRFVLSTEVLMAALQVPNFDYIKNRKYSDIFPKYFGDSGMTAFTEAFNKTLESGEAIRFDYMVDFELSGQPRYYAFELSRAGAGLQGKERELSGVLTVMVDMTDIMREKQRAEAANNAKSEFLATMSHEIRTPMNAIIGMSEMLSRSEMTGEQKKYVTDIRKSSGSLLTIINDILDFSKIEAGKMELVNTSFNLKMLLDNLQSMFSMLCHDKNLNLAVSISENMPDMVFGDETRFRQVLTNILSNALKYTKQGEITFSSQLNDDFLQFSIKDTGMGIRDEDKGKLFKPFEQLDVRKNRNVVGTGLGLAITYNLCRLMGGELWFESTYGEGSTFYINLPYVKTDRESIEEPAAVSEFTAPEARILVVDDIEINLSVAEALLSTFRIIPDLALSGAEALELVKKNRYDIIFMDHMMPEMNGLDATKRIRELGGWNDEVPIIALTANAIIGVEQMFLSNRMDDFLSKPLNIATLNLCLRKWLPIKLVKE